MCDLMFVSFGKYLRGIDGGQRSEKTAGEIAKDVSKYLKYACGGEEVDWMTLTERDRLLGYVDKLKRVKVGPDGQLGKLDALSCALRFIKVSLPHDASPALFSKIAAAEAALGGWKTTLRKDKRRLRKVRLQKLSEESLSLDEVSQLLDCRQLWIEFNDTCLGARRREAVAASRLDEAAVVLAGSLLYKNDAGTSKDGAQC
jgi:hypothetical protein